MQLVRDIPSSSSFWGATWVFGCFPDLHIIGDAPIGCYNLLGVAVTNYTDALPHLANFTPTSISQQDVINGTTQTLKKTFENLRSLGHLENKRLIVLSSAESEMIGANHAQYLATLDPQARFFWSQSLEQDEWVGRERALLFLWEEYGKPFVSAKKSEAKKVNLIGPSLGCFNSAADLHEIKRLITGIGGEINLVYPYEAKLAETPQLAEAAANIVLYREFGEELAKILGQPYLFAPFGLKATTTFLQELGKILNLPAENIEAFIAQEKRTTLQPVWDLWLGPQSDWFATIDCAIVASRSYVDGLKQFLGEELGMKVVWAAGRPHRADEPDSLEIRAKLHEKAPTFVFGSINEKIYLAEANAKGTFHIPAAFPGPIVRRTTGTPFMGFAGTAHLMQEIINRLYETVFNFLPIETISSPSPTGMPSGAGKPPVNMQTMPWTKEATERLQQEVENVPYLSRISASQNWRQAAETVARARGSANITLEIVEIALKAK